MAQTPRVGRPIKSKIESDNSNNQATSISFKRASSYQSLDPELCRHCLATRKIGHDCTRKALIENVITVLQAKGVEDEVIAAVLRRKAEKLKSHEIEVDRLRVRLLNGRPHEAPSITKDDLGELLSEVSMSEESLRKIVKWLKLHGIKSPSAKVYCFWY